MTLPTPPPGNALGIVPVLDKRVGTMHVNGNKRYADGAETWQRMSTLLKNLKTMADSEQLVDWKLRQVAIGMSKRPDLVLGVAAAVQLDPETGKLTWDAKKTINNLCRQAGDAAGNKSGSNSGSAVHTATERLDLGESVEAIGLPYPYSADLQAYATLKKAMGLTFRPEHIERSVRNTELGIVGTYDRFGSCSLLVERGMLAEDELICVDVKTEKDPLLNLIHIAPQLAGYANADAQFVPDPEPARAAAMAGRVATMEELTAGHYEDLPRVSKSVGLVIHVRDGRATPLLVNLIEGWEAAKAAAAQRERVKRSNIKLGEPGCWAMPLDVPLPATAAIVQAAAEKELAAARVRAELPTVEQALAAVPSPYAGTLESWSVAQQIAGPCPNCAPLLAGASTTRVDGSEADEWCHACGAPAPVQATPVTGPAQVAVRGSDGMVRWEDVPAVDPGLIEHLLSAIGDADSTARLAELYDLATGQGVTWDGEVAAFGAKRGAIVSCVQRDLHTGTGACACGWRTGLAS